MSAKRDETREGRLVALIEASARGVSVPPLRSLEKARAARRRAAGSPRVAGTSRRRRR
jgi:hypothetical protein